MKRVLFISPHLSTGGLPQYLLKKINTFKEYFDISVIEWSNITGRDFIVQKKEIEALASSRSINYYCFDDDKERIFEIIEKEKPYIIHFEEIPETFIDTHILDRLYSEDRSYNIVVTTHSSFTKPESLKYLADKFILVSQWSKKVFNSFFKGEIPCEVWEYPVEKQIYNKEEAKRALNFQSEYKHVLHVGLFTPGKNQKEIVELAKLCSKQKIKFHFVGNQASNFKDYWQPIMNSFPDNCVWWGEREDVDNFYRAADAFYFPSLFELNPISLKEAQSFGLPILVKNLETYSFENASVSYLTDSVEENKKILYSVLGVSEEEQKKVKPAALHILTDIDSKREIRSMQSLTKVEDWDYVSIISKRYTDLPPAETCQYPDRISLEPGGKLTPAHYGCYLGHRKAFEEGLKMNRDYIVIFECDAIIDIPYEEFISKMELANKLCIENNYVMFSFGYHNNTDIVFKAQDHWAVNKFYGAHAYLIPRKSYSIIKDMYEYSKWNVTDLLFCENLNKYKIGIFETPITKQAGGYSILDKIENNDRY